MHVNKNIMDGEMRRIDPQKADIMGRLGRSNYVRVKGDNILSLYQPVRPACIGYDSLPSGLRKSRFFTGNDLGKFAALNTLPDFTEVENFMRKEGLQPDEDREFYHRRAKRLLDENRIDLALKMALIPEIG